MSFRLIFIRNSLEITSKEILSDFDSSTIEFSVSGLVDFFNPKTHLKLETGEIFCTTSYLYQDTDEPDQRSIVTELIIKPRSHNLESRKDDSLGTMSYWDIDDETSISFNVIVSDEYFSMLIKNIHSGIYPKTIEIDPGTYSDDYPIEEGANPFTQYFWYNKKEENRKLKIIEFKIIYSVTNYEAP